jgi:hypothetical protein
LCKIARVNTVLNFFPALINYKIRLKIFFL